MRNRSLKFAQILFIFTVLFSLPITWCVAAETAEPPTRSAENQKLAVLVKELADEAALMGEVNKKARARFREDELNMTAELISAASLERARLELVGKRLRSNSLDTRMATRREALAIAKIDKDAMEKRQPSAEEKVAYNQELAEREAEIELLRQLIDGIQALKSRYTTATTLARQNLNLLQSRFELPALDKLSSGGGRAERKLQRSSDQLLAEAAEYRRQSRQYLDNSQEHFQKRSFLELNALVAEERAEYRQMSIRALRYGLVIKTLETFAVSESAPIRVLRSGIRNLEDMRGRLKQELSLIDQKLAQFEDQVAIVKQQDLPENGAGDSRKSRIDLLEDLKSGAKIRREDFEKQLNSLDQIKQSFNKTLTSAQHRELIERRQLPADADAWADTFANLKSLPSRIVKAITFALQNLWHGIYPDNIVPVIILMLATLPGIFYLRKFLNARIAAAAADGADPVAYAPVEILNRNLFTLWLPTVALVIFWLAGIARSEMILLMAPLLIVPAVRIVLSFVNELLDAYTPELNASKTRLLELELRWVTILTALLVSVVVLAQTVALSPAVIDVIDRASMLFLLLVALPILHLRRLLFKGLAVSKIPKLVGGLTLVIPMVLVVAALTGLMGFVQLAWTIASTLAALIAVAVLLHFALGILREALRRFQRRLEKSDPERAAFVAQNVLKPLYTVLAIGLLIVATFVLGYLLEWNAETPIVKIMPRLFDFVLFDVKGTNIAVSDVVLAFLILYLSLWSGSWSRQVSNRWVYTRVADTGIRNSLATFTQYIVVLLGVVLAMKAIGLDLTALTVFAGALGVGIGFGMQQIVVNFISGILLLVERPLATTDLVNVDKYEGEVTRIGIRSLTVKTFDNQEVIIPNSSVITKPFTNWTRGDDIMRTVLLVGISYNDDPHKAIALIKELLQQNGNILADPAPKVLLWDYADSALMIRLQFHSRIRGPVGRPDLRSEVLLAIWDAFAEHGITIPFPQRDVHFYGTQGAPMPTLGTGGNGNTED